MILKGIGKGSTLLAAALPLKTLAASSTLLVTPTGKNGAPAGLRCSVSGMQSGVHSRETGTVTTCGGYSPGWWGQREKDDDRSDECSDSSKPRRTWPVSPSLNCLTIFTQAGSDDPGVDFSGKTLFQVMSDSRYARTKTRHWIGAWLNGLSGGPTATPYPYSGDEVLAYYKGTLMSQRAAMYSLIVTYLEIH